MSSGASGAGGPLPNDVGSGRDSADINSRALAGRPDLEKDALQELRARQRALKTEAKRVAQDLKSKKKQKKRALKRCSVLDTRDIVQVSLERGVAMPGGASGALSSSSPSAAPDTTMALALAVNTHDANGVPSAAAAMAVADDVISVGLE